MFRSTIATVKGPTPPGTGVIQPACSTALSNSTSPVSLLPLGDAGSGMRLIPTSMTAAPFFIMLPVMSAGCPAAAMRISACCVIRARFAVLLWQRVTVASTAVSKAARGFPTIADRPTITAWAPLSGIPYSCSAYIIPCGVQGINPGVPVSNLPKFSGVKPSISFAGLSGASIRLLSSG